MKSRKIFAMIFLALVVMAFVNFNVVAQEEEGEDIQISGFDLEEIISFVNGWLSVFLFILAYMAYKRDGRKRLFYVSLAFLLFAVKSFLNASELFFPDMAWVGPTATVLEFLVLLSFFFGVIRK